MMFTMMLMKDTPEAAEDTESLVVTIDGPAASGKSSVARRVAKALKVPFVSSGLLYRAATYLVLEQAVDPEDAVAVNELLDRHDVELLAQVERPNKVVVDGEDITEHLHTDEVDSCVSLVSRHSQVRAWVYERLRDIRGAFVIEGRDMGTVVFPDAARKFYLTAPAEVRAGRRVGQRLAGLAEVTEALRRRDALDSKQLAPAEDAVELDTTHLRVADVVEAILRDLAGMKVGETS